MSPSSPRGQCFQDGDFDFTKTEPAPLASPASPSRPTEVSEKKLGHIRRTYRVRTNIHRAFTLAALLAATEQHIHVNLITGDFPPLLVNMRKSGPSSEHEVCQFSSVRTVMSCLMSSLCNSWCKNRGWVGCFHSVMDHHVQSLSKCR